MKYTEDFKQLFKRIERTHLGKPVPFRHKEKYGKIYNKKEILPLTEKIAKKRGIQITK